MTEDGTITLDQQRKTLEYLLSPPQQKEPPRLERIYDFALARKAHKNSKLAAGNRSRPAQQDRTFYTCAESSTEIRSGTVDVPLSEG